MRRRFLERDLGETCLYLFADSSPQAGSDWLLSTCLMISADRLEETVQAALALRDTWQEFTTAVGEHEDLETAGKFASVVMHWAQP